ncbi:MAG: radical SAM protein [Candidatus Omnitrophica bacterium]|nr:radical SAM protein [Candidatus Omnitrophota bacterium]
MKVILVQPSALGGVQSLFTFHKKEGLGHKPPLGILILATYLISRGMENVYCLDAQLDNLTPQDTAQKLAEMNPDIIGFTVWTDFWYPTWQTVKLIKEKLPLCKIILGGPHCSVYQSESLEHSQADYLIAGDAEEALFDLLSAIQQKGLIGDIAGVWRKDGRKIIAPKSAQASVSDYTRIPAPNRRLLPHKRYNSILTPKDYETTMITSRGCPYRCVFCKMNTQKVYARSAEQVVDEFSEIAAMGISDIQVYDDTFTWSKKRVIDICTGILNNKLKINWAIRDRVNMADAQVYSLMRQAGCYRIHYGVESGSEQILKESGKGITLKEAKHAIELAKKTGFTTLAYYMFGFLDERYEDALETIEFASRLDSDYAVFAVLIPYPDTALYKIGLEKGILPYDFWLEYTKNPTPDFKIPSLIEQHMDRNTLIALKNTALRRYYLRPKRILREIKSLSSFCELRRKSAMALNVIMDTFKSSPKNKNLW